MNQDPRLHRVDAYTCVYGINMLVCLWMYVCVYCVCLGAVVCGLFAVGQHSCSVDLCRASRSRREESEEAWSPNEAAELEIDCLFLNVRMCVSTSIAWVIQRLALVNYKSHFSLQLGCSDQPMSRLLYSSLSEHTTSVWLEVLLLTTPHSSNYDWDIWKKFCLRCKYSYIYYIYKHTAV